MKKLNVNHTINCRSIKGEVIGVPIDKIRFRNSVYGIITHEEKILLVRTQTTGLYAFPGGGIQLGEPIKDALLREIHEETGINVSITRFFYFTEDFFYFDPQDIGFHSFLFFYLCTPLTTELVADEDVIDFYAEKPRWLPIKNLDPGEFLPGIREALSLYLKTLA